METLKTLLFGDQFFISNFLKIGFFEISTSNGCISANFEARGLPDSSFCHKFYLVYASDHNSVLKK